MERRGSSGSGRFGASPSMRREGPALWEAAARHIFSPTAAPLPPEVSRAEYMRFESADFHGIGRSKTVPMRNAHKPVFLYSGAAAMGPRSALSTPPEVKALGCPNTQIIPDWSTARLVEHAPGRPTARVLCDQTWTDGRPMPSCPRHVLRTALESLAATAPEGAEGEGAKLLAACEYEFTLCDVAPANGDDDGGGLTLTPAFGGVDIFNTMQNAKTAEFQQELDRSLLTMGVDLQTLNAEYGVGQLEITYSPHFGLDAGDAAFTFKGAVKEIAQNHGRRATFMTRPFADADGASNGGHTNMSVWCGETNLLQDDDAPDGLSEYGRHFLAGMLEHARALQALAAPTVNCYHRVQLDSWAPVVASWGFDNRTCMVRVKTPKTCPGCASAYFEWRQPGSAANPYIVLAGAVAAGVDGVQRKLGPNLPPPATGYHYDAVRGDAAAKTDHEWIPTSLRGALDAFKQVRAARARARARRSCEHPGAARYRGGAGVRKGTHAHAHSGASARAGTDARAIRRMCLGRGPATGDGLGLLFMVLPGQGGRARFVP